MLRATLTALTLLAATPDARPPTYPAFLPFISGGEDQVKISDGFTTVLHYPEADTVMATRMRELLKKDGWAFEEDKLEGLSGVRFIVRKDGKSAYFTIKPGYTDKPTTTMIVTDTRGK